MFPAIFFVQKARPDRRRFGEGEASAIELFLSHFAGLE
jgi:hypothetical protein